MDQNQRWALSLFEAFLRLTFQSGTLSFLIFRSSHQFLAKSLGRLVPQLSNNLSQIQHLKNDGNLTLNKVSLRLVRDYSIFLCLYRFACLKEFTLQIQSIIGGETLQYEQKKITSNRHFSVAL